MSDINNTFENKYDFDFFYEIFEQQRRLQAKMGEPLGEGEKGGKEALLSVMVEASEALDELNWKPWKKTKKEVELHKFATELTDIIQFVVNAALAMGLNADDLRISLIQKWEVNHKRIKEKY